MRKFTSVTDVSDVSQLVNEAISLKKNPYRYQDFGREKTLGLLFFNPSLRTRLSTQKAAQSLGMQVMVMNLNSDGWTLEMEDGAVMNQGSQEHIKDAAAVISQYCDIVGIRTFPSLDNREEDYNDTVIQRFVKYSTVPIISLESAIRHPLQSLADLITIEEQSKKAKPKIVLSWAPHPKALPQAVANSFAEWVQKVDADLVVTQPKGFELSSEFTEGFQVEYDQHKAFEGADFIYAKNWSSYQDYGKIGKDMEHWMIDSNKMALTDNAKFMHCLPLRRNVVASDAVMDGGHSLVIEQANNRTYAAQVVLLNLLKNEI